jgi:hypothetical protein
MELSLTLPRDVALRLNNACQMSGTSLDTAVRRACVKIRRGQNALFLPIRCCRYRGSRRTKVLRSIALGWLSFGQNALTKHVMSRRNNRHVAPYSEGL